ncbi:N-acetyltransferase [Peptoniphilus sp. KCTC 25270]|uniref:GNAT family N-acetyltransferase n=1 Tax=Peptoniphilus sp. KCTC 25270 TaxID=2897414 RepID=UPI001E4B22A6|nr:GNAT family N-acetyltransferase [Peptoniphilus sp. KCTC 25270]MCD1147236.1 N-acetyltransferase [Peptoniphilus sp. KCTC 25270]
MKIEKMENRFYIGEKEDPKAFLDFRTQSEGIVNAYHTVVKPELQGGGVAGKLYEAFMEYVKENDLKVVPSCSYIDKKMNEKEEDKGYIAK